ncbi:conserved hypothetical protein [Histoplasma capsulatum G186AR]|uniref:Sin3 binding protein n=2 Tax=Ajellomyces capsulatus TaxID=5037 RepID=C0NUG1_AJECG|nr:uncharacterized protein HCBG_06992 [Histoplasma capsulatum G186AR]EEH05041.1 conserved hypothetical protein [Histoplasma capsulatum G186AR]KAG5287693.1 Stb3 superfamily domain-containing protein [Histoplasma capsulatum]QSS70493.1 Stb3 superfamily domain-containing protein [Histoplasma capsulatum G186AR]
MATRPASSSIAMALAGKTASVEIPKPRGSGLSYGRDSLAAVPTRHHGQPTMLPTPPNSLSPNINPHGFKRHHSNLPASPPYVSLHVDSDIDLQDAVDHAKGQDQHHHPPLVAENLSSLAGSDAISPGMLAKYHLPDILLTHGPLAIRHIIGYLTTSVPGFSRIPPAKARRLVVGALEGRGNGEGAGVDGGVEFEKVGWGRWDARRHNQPPRHTKDGPSSPPGSVPSSHRIQIPAGRGPRDFSGQYGSSMAGDSVVFSHSDFDCKDHEDITMLEHEADKMSLDGDDRASYCSSSETPEDEIPMDGDWDEADVTDEEDWAQIGAAALRARSYPSVPEGGTDINNTNAYYDYNTYAAGSKGRGRGHGGGPSYSALTKSVPGGIPIQPVDIEERAAVEALLQLGSM